MKRFRDSGRARAPEGLWAAALVLCLGWPLPIAGQSGITQEGPLTVFRSGGTETLLTTNLQFVLPQMEDQPILRLDLGFSTDEPEAGGTFYDSFSVSLQGTNASLTALLLTADRTGVQWAPVNSGGMAVTPADVESSPTNFPGLLPDLALKVAYSISFAIPAALAGNPATLFLDLFDNLNTAASVAWIGNVRVDSSAAQVFRLFSAPTVGGPYTEESASVLDGPAKTFLLALPPGIRFFRVQADRPVRITSIQVTNGQLAIRFTDVLLRVQNAATPAGPFADHAGFVLDAPNRRFLGPLPAAPSFYRITGDQQVVITAIRVSGGQLIIEYEEVRLRLLTAATVDGSYVDGPSHFVNASAGTITVARPAANQFYRVQGNARARLTGMRVAGSELVLDYVLVP